MARHRLLVIDNNPTVDGEISRAASMLGLKIYHVPDGGAATAEAIRLQPDIILLDYEIPGTNYSKICKELKNDQTLRSTPVILMYDRSFSSQNGSMDTWGITDFITKPLSQDALLAVVQHALRKYSDFDGATRKPNSVLYDMKKRVDERQLPLGRNQKAAISGDLSEIQLTEVLQLLKYQGRDGVLILSRNDMELAVFFRKGTIAFARARGVDEEFLLGRFLLEIGAMTRGDLDVFIKNRGENPGMLLGEQLLKLGDITQDELQMALEKQTQELLYESIRWPDGEFAFYVGSQSLEQAASPLDLSVDFIIMEGVRRVDEWGIIEKEIKDFERILAPNRDSTGVRKLVKLRPEEKAILSLVDGQRTIRDIIRISKRSSFDTCKVLYQLVTSRIIRKKTMTNKRAKDD